MNSVGQPATRQTNWKFILITVGSTVGLAFLFLKLFWLPWQESNRRLTNLESEVDNREREFAIFMKERKRLEVFRLLGLPRNLEKGGSDYARYCQRLLRECGFKIEDFQGPTGTEARNLAPLKGKKADHITLTFLVRAQGDWAGLMKMLEKFQRTPLLHRLKSWNLEQESGSKEKSSRKLVVNFTIEALVVNNNKKRPDDLWGVDPRAVGLDAVLALQGGPVGWAMLLRGQALVVPEMPDRHYADLARANPFAGGRFLGWKDIRKRRDNRPPDGRSSVHLTLIDHSAQKALLLAETKSEKFKTIKLDTTDAHDQFEIWDGKGLMKAKVLRVDPRDIYVRVGKEVYTMHIGQNLAEAMKRPLPAGERIRLGLVDSIDQ
jgi:hypothetical protein